MTHPMIEAKDLSKGYRPDELEPKEGITCTGNPTPRIMPIKYRPDVDGLRALAVLSVISFISNRNCCRVGVDVFFVISGYLISKLIIGEIDNNAFSFVLFYERRIRRIFPALFALLLIGAVAAFLFLTPTPFLQYINSSAAAALSTANIYFYMHSGYFDLGASELPLLHTWSLAVEEQFYLLFPAIFLIGKRVLRLRWPWIIMSLAIFSLGVGIVQTFSSRTAAFYLPASRSWEFLLGSLLALGILPKLSQTASEIVGTVGLALLVAALVVFSRSMPFPGWIALIPCLGAFLIIFTGECRTGLVQWALSCKVAVFIGLISYSLYLWHWPVLVFVRLFCGGSLSIVQNISVLFFILALSWISWRYIEQPVRRNRAVFTRRTLFLGASAFIVVFVGMRNVANDLHGLPQRFSPEATRLLIDDKSTLSEACRSAAASGGECTVGSPLGVETFAVVGDSYGGALLPGIDFQARESRLRGSAFIKPGCYPLIEVQVDRPACTAFVRQAFDQIRSNPQLKTVLLVGRWSTAIESQRSGSEAIFTGFLQDFRTQRAGYDENRAVLARGFERTRDILKVSGLLVVAHVPEQQTNVPISAVFRLVLGQNYEISVPVAIVEKREIQTRRILADLAAKYRYSILDASTVMCDEHKCAGIKDGRSLYSDDNHLSVYGSNFLARSGFYSIALSK
jgi:peptidoglycan/LPS O-acetylase OafA/YrhL